MTEYIKRNIDTQLIAWKEDSMRKPLLLRGARQVGKSSAVKHFGKQFKYFAEVNFERNKAIKTFFHGDLDVRSIAEKISSYINVPVEAGKTLLFLDEIQECPEAIMALRFFKEDYPELHVIAAGSLLEFTLEELPSFGVGRIRSLYMYPFSFDEFLLAQGLDLTIDYKRKATPGAPIPEAVHNKLVNQLKTFYLVGGMPAAVTEWIETNSYLECAHVHNDILDTYQDDFSKYKSRISPTLLRKVLRSVALQARSKFVFRQVDNELHSSVIKDALHLLTLAGLIKPVTHTDGNGLPLGAEENNSYTKYLFLDLGLMQTMLGTPAADILLSSDVDFVNKGAASEMFAGLELMKGHDCFQKSEMYYWQNLNRGANAEIDYIEAIEGKILPVEVKASTRGSMQSLWLFMRKKNLHHAIRTSLENFGRFEYIDKDADDAVRQVDVIPLYALGNLYK